MLPLRREKRAIKISQQSHEQAYQYSPTGHQHLPLVHHHTLFHQLAQQPARFSWQHTMGLPELTHIVVVLHSQLVVIHQ